MVFAAGPVPAQTVPDVQMVATPTLRAKVNPQYSPEARAAGLQGTVLLSLDVKPDGAAENVRIRRGLGLGLDEEALKAVKQWRYEPTSLDRPVVEEVELPFRLDDGGPWRIVGSQFSLPAATGQRIKPALAVYVNPDAATCTKNVIYVPVDLQVGTDGTPSAIRVALSGEDSISQAVRDAVKSWRFRPAVADGEPAVSSGTILLECRAPGTSVAPAEGVYKVGGGVSAPSIIFKVDPEYSEEARKAKFNGSVLLALVVDSEGRARDIRVARPLGLGLDREAIVAVNQWRFRPGMKDGKPVNVRASIEINFRLL